MHVQARTQQQLLTAEGEAAEAKAALQGAQREVEQALLKDRTNELRKEHTASLQEELTKARKEVQELLLDNKNDEVIRLKQNIEQMQRMCNTEKVRKISYCMRLGTQLRLSRE
jgi:SLT domain-containing protein